jgi:hypothetical protein
MVAALSVSGCGKSVYYPQSVGACVDAQNAREQMKTATGEERALLEAKVQGLEEACKNSMRQKADDDKAHRRPPLP